MKTHVNPAFSELSFLLSQPDGTSAREKLVQLARDLANAAAELNAWPEPPTDAAQGKQVFYEYAAALRSDATSLVRALEAADRGAATKTFEELRKKCDSCHHYFRYGE